MRFVISLLCVIDSVGTSVERTALVYNYFEPENGFGFVCGVKV